MKKLTKENLAGIPHSTLSKNKKGNYVVRKGYFYRNGMSEQIIADAIKAKFPNAEIINTWDKFVPFRGGQTVAQGSHFGVEFKINE